MSLLLGLQITAIVMLGLCALCVVFYILRFLFIMAVIALYTVRRRFKV